MPRSEIDGPCVVCGEATYNRCSDCLKFGTDWMYFCSIEHKKLVFPVHKRVCGIRSKPFCWPGLDREEEKDYLALGRTPYTNMTEYGGSGKGMRSWFDEFCETAPVNKETALETFIQYLEMWRDPGRGKPFPVQDNLIQLRLTSMTTAIAVDRDKTGAGPDSISNLPALMCSRPIDYVLAILDRTMPGLAQKCDDFAPWAHKFLHKFLLHAAMSIADIEHRSVKYDTYLIWMREDLEQIYFKDIRRTHPHLFQQAFEALDMFPDRRVCRKNLRRG